MSQTSPICQSPLQTPVVLIIFKRPETTQQVFEAIRQAQPKKLFVVADGPRPDREGEAEKCALTRAIIDQVDWNCEVLTNYSEINLGCGNRVPSGLDWVFEQVEEAIILEDDCVPHPTFFRFCEELLERYRFDDRVFSISAQNFAKEYMESGSSYHFSRYPHCWGWATWRRAWKNFDLEIKNWEIIKQKRLLELILQDALAVKTWKKVFQKAHEDHRNFWSFQWTLSCWLQRGLSIHPNVHLVTNIGFGAEGTNTLQEDESKLLKLSPAKFPLIHPPFVLRDSRADQSTQKTLFNVNFNPDLLQKTKWKIQGLRRKTRVLIRTLKTAQMKLGESR